MAITPISSLYQTVQQLNETIISETKNLTDVVLHQPTSEYSQTVQKLNEAIGKRSEDLILTIPDESTETAFKIKNNISILIELASQISIVYLNEIEKLRQLQQIDIQGKIKNIESLLELRKKLKNEVLDDLSKRLELTEQTEYLNKTQEVMDRTRTLKQEVRITAEYDTGLGNYLSIRGNKEAGLSWSKGKKMKNLGHNLWESLIEVDKSSQVVFKILINDQQWENSDNHITQHNLKYAPRF